MAKDGSQSQKRVLVVSDLHVGSIYGMMPPDFVSSAGAQIVQNAGQKYLWQCWQHMASTVGPVDVLVVNGDAIDGAQQAQQSTELCLPIIEDQSEAAFHCLDYLQKTLEFPKIFCIAGTEYHDQRAAREMEVIAQRLGAQKYQGLGTGRYCREVLDLEINGAILNFSHGTSIASGLYRATPPDREGVWSALAGKTGKSPKADCLVRSHAHFFVHVEHTSKHIVQTGCWELQTRYMRRHSVYRMLPDIGYCLVNVDVKRNGDDPCHVEKKIYPLPEPKVTHL